MSAGAACEQLRLMLGADSVTDIEDSLVIVKGGMRAVLRGGCGFWRGDCSGASVIVDSVEPVEPAKA